MWRDLADRYYDLLEEGKVILYPKNSFLQCKFHASRLLTDLSTPSHLTVQTLVPEAKECSKIVLCQTLRCLKADIAYPDRAALQVYYLSKGKVKPANKAYSSVRNDYQLHLDTG